MDILKRIQEELGISYTQVQNTVELLDEGNTIPFIARYRKEVTGTLDDQTIRELSDRLTALRNLETKREQVIATIEEQGNLTEEISEKLAKAMTVTEIDDIYRPFRPKRTTRASIAKEKGLTPLSEILMSDTLSKSIESYCEDYINEEKGILTVEDALNGAKDILAEQFSDNDEIRKDLRNMFIKFGSLTSKQDEDTTSVYDMYKEYEENVKSIAPHRVLAINRGEKEGFLSIKVQLEEEKVLDFMSIKLIPKNSPCKEILEDVVADSYKRLLFPSLEREIRNSLTEQSEDSALKVFGENLKQLLLQPPIMGKIVLALDPAFRTGCKIAVIDETGKPLETTVIYPTAPQNKVEQATKTLCDLINKYDVDLISIGNGTASRESEEFVAKMIKENKFKKSVKYLITNEAGASVYSASKLGAEEFPQYDVSLRSAVSIGRRVQDPLAELVKIDPKSIGVGQYQHDMNQKRLGEVLGGVVEDCVNSVGVDLNTASPSLLSYVAGINNTVSKNILIYREENGKFVELKELKKVPKLGAKSFLQCAGFLRILDGKSPLDKTGIHPESYKIAEKLLKSCGFTLDDIGTEKLDNFGKQIGSLEEKALELEVGIPTLQDIVKEIEKPARDPRNDAKPPVLRSDVLSMEDLEIDMILTGTVRNVIDFGAFVDIGVHQDGLVHISQISDKFIKHPLDAVKIGDIVDVKIISVDIQKKRIALTMKL